MNPRYPLAEVMNQALASQPLRGLGFAPRERDNWVESIMMQESRAAELPRGFGMGEIQFQATGDNERPAEITRREIFSGVLSLTEQTGWLVGRLDRLLNC